MSFIKKISQLIKLDKVQRFCYLFALLTWLLMWQNEFYFYDAKSSIGVKYIWLISIPAALLLLQVIFNKTFLWATIFGFVVIYTIYAAYMTMTDLIERSGNHPKAISWNLKTFLILTIAFGVVFIINFMLFKLKPTKTEKKHIA